MKIKFVPIDYDYFDYGGKNVIKLVGRTSEGKRVCILDSYEPNFWVILEQGLGKKEIGEIESKIKKIEVKKGNRVSKVIRTEVKEKNFLGEKYKAIKVFVTNHKDLHDVADEIGFKGVYKRREYDIPLITKYIMEKKVEPLKFYEVSGEVVSGNGFGAIGQNLEVDMVLFGEDFKETEGDFEPRVLAYDIETDDFEIGGGDVLMISLYGMKEGKKYEKVLTWKKCNKKQDFVECVSSESKMLERFVEEVKDFEPDFLVGYFSDNFDLPYLRAAAENNKIGLPLGLDGCPPTFSRGKFKNGKINGIVHVDLFRFIDAVYSQYLQSETMNLNDVASELLGQKKHDFDFKKLGNMNHQDWKDFFGYNLQDSILTWKLFEKVWPDVLEFSKIVLEPAYDITRDRMSSHVENYILHNLERFDEIAEKRPVHEEIGKRRSKGKYEGAFVFQPTPGLYEDIGVFDFTSMHASIIVSMNISKSTITDKKKGNYKTPEFTLDGKKGKFYFEKEKGFFPTMLEEVVNLRKKYKKEYKKDSNHMTRARSNAYKLLANASYGYLGFFGARYYCRECAASTLAFVRDYTNQSIDKIKKEGYGIIFSDTDSIGFTLDGKSEKDTKEFLRKLNNELPGIMELELEGFYKRGLFVSKRTTTAGAKKKYALLEKDDRLKIRGFETVRRDWCNLARKLQNRVLKNILKDGNEKRALEMFKEFVRELKEQEVEKEDLIIKTQLKKPINEYLSEGPHVVAAKRMEEQDIPVSQGNLIEYYVADVEGKRVGDKVRLPGEEGDYSVDYYLNNQIVPAVENIFNVFDVNLEDVIAGNRQAGLGEF